MQYRSNIRIAGELRRYGHMLRPKRRKRLKKLLYDWCEVPRSRQRYFRKRRQRIDKWLRSA